MSDKKNLSHKDIEALNYHSEGRPGKIAVTPTKPTLTSHELSLAYSPGVAIPCMEIARDEEEVFKYTAKGNLVGVISNGSAVLGLGNIGALAGKPVMEGKGVLFKKFADIDVFDIEVNESTVEGMVKVVEALEPTFGGINLEDIKAPECFEIEKQLVEKMNIPVFHDDQHGTAIIASAAFVNAVELVGKKIEDLKVVFSGAGAAALACANLFFKMGVRRENLFMCDSKGVIYQGREKGMNKYKDEIAVETKHRTMADAINGADAFIGCSMKGLLTKEMVKTMAKDPIIFAMANPDPEILPEEVAEVRDDAIMATGRSDYPNQVNNVLGFPFIFRGALDVRARKINDEMKLAAVHALADLAREEVPEDVKRAYGNEEFKFGRSYLIPKPFDKRVLTRVAPAVAKAACETGVAKLPIDDFEAYAGELAARLGVGQAFMKSLRDRIDTKNKPKIVYAEGQHTKILKAVNTIVQEGRIEPILIGDPKVIKEKAELNQLYHLDKVEIIRPDQDERLGEFTDFFYNRRQRKGISKGYASELMEQGNYFGSMLVRKGYADGMVTGAARTYPECFKPVMQIIGTVKRKHAAGIIILVLKNKVMFLADCTVQFNPDAESLANTAVDTAQLYRYFTGSEPKVAFLSFSNFGSTNHPETVKMAKAAELAKELDPTLICEGEIQADVAVNKNLQEEMFPFNKLEGGADILIFPNLSAANIAYKLVSELGDADIVGPILAPLQKSINIVQRTSSVTQIINNSTLTAFMSKFAKKDS